MKGYSDTEGGLHAPSNPENAVNPSMPTLKVVVRPRRMTSSKKGAQGERALASWRARRMSEVVVKGDKGLVAEAETTGARKQGVGSCDLVINL